MESKHDHSLHVSYEPSQESIQVHIQKGDLLPGDSDILRADMDQPVVGTSSRMGIRTVIALIIVNTTLLLVGLDNTLVATALPAIVDDLHHLNHISWYGSAFLVGMASTQSFWGKVFTFWRVKTAYISAICIFEVGNLLCSTAHRDDVFIIGRALAGTGGAGVMAGTFLVTALAVPPAKRPVLLGLVSAVLVLAAIIGPTIGGVVVSKLTWRWAFYLSLPLGGVSISIIALCLTVPGNAINDIPIKTKLSKLDIPGMLATICFVTALLQALVWGGVTKPWHSATVIGCLVASLVSLVLLVAIEIVSGEEAAMNCKLMTRKTIALQLPFTLTMTSTFYLALYYIPIYFQVVSGLGALQSGLRTLPMTSTSGITAALTGLLLSKTGEYQIVMLASGLLASVGSGLLQTLDASSSAAQQTGLEVVLALGMGLGYFVGVTVCQDAVPTSELARANATILSLQQLANAVTLSVGQSVFSNILLSSLNKRLSSASAATIFAAGPDRLRTSLPADLVQDALDCYLLALRRVFMFLLALCLVSVIASAAVLVFDRRKLSQGKDGTSTSDSKSSESQIA